MKVKTMNGKVIDVGALLAQNETTVAIGNANMNARGDILGPGGVIQKRREQVAQEYHNANPNAVKQVSLKEVQPDFMTPQEAVEKLTGKKAEAKKSGPKIVDSDE